MKYAKKIAKQKITDYVKEYKLDIKNYKVSYMGENGICFYKKPFPLTGYCGTNVTYEITDDNGIIISGEGDINNYENCPFSGQNRNCISNIIIGDGIKNLGDGCFQYCYLATGLTIGNGVEKIGDSVFQSCMSVSDLTITSNLKEIGNRGLNNMQSLTSLTLPDSVEVIGQYCFQQASITSLDLPNNLKSLGYMALSYLTKLRSINYKGTSYNSKSAILTALSNNGVVFPDGTNRMFDTTPLND